MPRRRNTPGGPAAFAAYANGPGAAPPPPPARPSKAKAGAAYASRFVKSPDNWWLLLLLASAALYAQLLDAALAPKALEGFAVTGDAKFYRDVVARHAKARVLVDGLGPLSSPVWRAHDDANDLLFAEASAQRVWRHEDGTGLVRVGASVVVELLRGFDAAADTTAVRCRFGLATQEVPPRFVNARTKSSAAPIFACPAPKNNTRC